MSEKETLISFFRTSAGRKLSSASLFLRLFECNAFSERRIKLGKLDFALGRLLVLARPDDVGRLR